MSNYGGYAMVKHNNMNKDMVINKMWLWTRTLTRYGEDGFENLVLGQSGERMNGVARKGA
jgi:hypothetical protein